MTVSNEMRRWFVTEKDGMVCEMVCDDPEYDGAEIVCDRHEIVMARSAGQAKAIYLRQHALESWDSDLEYTDLRCRLAREGDVADRYMDEDEI